MSDKPTPEQVAAVRAQMDPTYTIIISERQRYYLHKALEQFISEDPGWEEDEHGFDIPTMLEEMLSNRGPDKLAPSPAVNAFVV